MAARKKDGLGYTLARLGFISDQDVTKFLSQQYRVPTVNLDEYTIESDILQLVSKDVCLKLCIIPVSRVGTSLIVAMADPTDIDAIAELKAHTKLSIEPVIASEAMIVKTIETRYPATKSPYPV